MKSQKKQFSKRRYNTKLRIKKRKQLKSKKLKRRFNKSRKKQRGGNVDGPVKPPHRVSPLEAGVKGKRLKLLNIGSPLVTGLPEKQNSKGETPLSRFNKLPPIRSTVRGENHRNKTHLVIKGFPPRKNSPLSSYECLKKHIYADIVGTIKFFFNTYLVPEKEYQKLQYVTENPFVDAYLSSIKFAKISGEGCEIDGREDIYGTQENAFEFEQFIAKIKNLLYPEEKRNLNTREYDDEIKQTCYTLKKYLMFNKYLILPPTNPNPNPFSAYEDNINILRKILIDSKPDNRTFMVGFSLLQALIIMSPYFNKLRILTCFDWTINKNNVYINIMLNHVAHGGEAYLFLPPFLRKNDIITMDENPMFRVTMLEIGIILHNEFTLELVTTEIHQELITELKKQGESPFNYPELMRIYQIIAPDGADKTTEKQYEIFISNNSKITGKSLESTHLRPTPNHNPQLAIVGRSKPVERETDSCNSIVPMDESYKTWSNIQNKDRIFGCRALLWLRRQGIFVDKLDSIKINLSNSEHYRREEEIDLTTTLTTAHIEDPLKEMYNYVTNPDNL